MKKIFPALLLLFTMYNYSGLLAQSKDFRNIENALSVIPDENYSDQPYIVIAKNGDWVCALTTGPGGESGSGQHIVATISNNKGKTWSYLIDIEPSQKAPAAASWVIPYITSYGRIYVFYTFNGDNIVYKPHSTLLGWYCFKYSDDNGRTWSDRYRIPMRKTTVDYFNKWHGDVQIFWGISKPLTINNSMYFSFSKIQNYVTDEGITEGWLYKSDNINTEKDPDKLHWEMFPDGETGICTTTFSSVQEEHNIVSLKNGDIYCVYRTITGFIGCSYSRDGGHTWSKPEFAKYSDGRELKHPRACPRLFQCSNGKFLLWFHNNNGVKAANDFRFRNPAWIVGGTEKNGIIQWSEPEILLYDVDTTGRMSYPDMVEENGKYYITETNKKMARVHAIDKELFIGVWNQTTAGKVTKEGLMFEKKDIKDPQTIAMGVLPNLENGGFTIDIWFETKEFIPNQIIFDNRDAEGRGIWLWITPQRTIQLSMSEGNPTGGWEDKTDPRMTKGWDTDPGAVQTGKLQHIVFVVDGAPNIITSIVNGKFCDGGRYRQFGWSWFSNKLSNVSGSDHLKLLPDFNGSIKNLRIYNRYLTSAEAVSNFRAGLK